MFYSIKKLIGLATLSVFLICSSNVFAQSKLKQLGGAPAFRALDEKGSEVTNQNFSNKFVIVNFFFTSCQGPCPILMEHVRKLAQDFPKADLELISFSVDPENDTPEKLANYKKERSLNDPRIHLLHINNEELNYLLNDGYKLGSAGEIINHSTRFVLIDRSGQIRITYSGDYPGLKSLVQELIN